MKFLKTYKVFESTENFDIKQIMGNVLSKSEKWVEVNSDFWDYQLEYKMNDSVKIRLIYNAKYGQAGLQYMMVETDPKTGEDLNKYWMYNYNEEELNYDIEDDYERMMANCEYHLDYFRLKPSDDQLNNIGDCFIEICDILGEPATSPQYGYIPDDFPFNYLDDNIVVEMPAPHLYASLVIIIPWYDKKIEDISKEELEEELYYSKDKVKQYISYTDIQLVYYEGDYNDDEIYIKIRLN